MYNYSHIESIHRHIRYTKSVHLLTHLDFVYAARAHSATCHPQIRNSITHTDKDRYYCTGENRSYDYGDKKGVKYLGLWLDNKLSFYEHIIQTFEKASKVAATLSWLMANVLMSIVYSILMYATEVWAEAIDQEFHR